jgi:hypothetical protein
MSPHGGEARLGLLKLVCHWRPHWNDDDERVGAFPALVDVGQAAQVQTGHDPEQHAALPLPCGMGKPRPRGCGIQTAFDPTLESLRPKPELKAAICLGVGIALMSLLFSEPIES